MDIEKIVSELMEELNLKAAHNDDEMYDIMKDAIGEDRTMMYLRKMDGLIGDKRFYDAKYEEPRAGYAYSGIYDGEFYPVLADWLKKNETKFGSEVLDVGCDCGIITCLMARMFPSSHFTAVDRSRNAIAAAEGCAGSEKGSGVRHRVFLPHRTGKPERLSVQHLRTAAGTVPKLSTDLRTLCRKTRQSCPAQRISSQCGTDECGPYVL